MSYITQSTKRRHNNRKSTRGRRVQTIVDKETGRVKTIRHSHTSWNEAGYMKIVALVKSTAPKKSSSIKSPGHGPKVEVNKPDQKPARREHNVKKEKQTFFSRVKRFFKPKHNAK